jgi:endoglucanase
MDMKILKELCEIPSPSNHEGILVKYLENLDLAHFQFKKSKKHSCSYTINRNSDKTVLLDAHLDQVHLRVVRITSDGYVVTSPVGFEQSVLDGNSVVHLASGMKGSVVTLPPHLNIKSKKTPEVYIDFGMNGRELMKVIFPGDIVIFSVDYYTMNKNYIVGPGLDNKVGVYILIEILKYFDKYPDKLKYNLIIHFSSREETGMSSFVHLPNKIDAIIVIDTDFATDNPFISPDLVGNLLSNNGPIITRNFEDDVCLGDTLIKIAKKNKIPFQLSYSSDFGGTNAEKFSLLFDSYTQYVGIPLKNMHAPAEIVARKDIENTFKLLQLYLTQGIKVGGGKSRGVIENKTSNKQRVRKKKIG